MEWEKSREKSAVEEYDYEVEGDDLASASVDASAPLHADMQLAAQGFFPDILHSELSYQLHKPGLSRVSRRYAFYRWRVWADLHACTPSPSWPPDAAEDPEAKRCDPQVHGWDHSADQQDVCILPLISLLSSSQDCSQN